MPRFVLLLHECPQKIPRATHCDLMLENAGVLRTWALQQLPRDWCELNLATSQIGNSTSNIVEAEQLPDHRLAYLEYEGPVSGDRGSVQQLDTGTFASSSEPNSFIIEGRILRGEVSFTPPASHDLPWYLEYRPASKLTD